MAGLLIRLVLAFSTFGVSFDVQAFQLVQQALHADPLHVYLDSDRWPYPPGFFPWILVSARLEILTHIELTDWVQLPSIAADIAIAWIVQHELGRRGHEPATRLWAAGLVALGPLFFMVSGFHGQIDSVAMLPAILAVLVWRRGGSRRALHAGALVAVGGLIKTVPLLAVLALLPHARSRREAAGLVSIAVVPVVIAFLPFALADPVGVETALRYRGVPGVGGLSLLVQPDLAETWITGAPQVLNGATRFLVDRGGLVLAAALVGALAYLYRRRPEPVVGAAIVYLVVLAFGVNFFLQYLIWVIPFLLMAGYVREVAAVQLLVVPAVVLVYGRLWPPGPAWELFAVVSLGLWACALAGLTLMLRNPLARRPAARPAAG
ncbi:MAG: glycosyltransferase 87 family protein [Thermoleophilaceae bacterium]